MVVEAGGVESAGTIQLPGPASTYGKIYPGTPVIALTNPVFFDWDGGMLFDAASN